MRLALVLHLYQPITQEKEVFQRVYASSYLPLLKLIKNKKLDVTLNTPLSLLQQMDSYGYTEWIDILRELVSTERVEIIGSAAYHPLLTKLPKKFVEEQVVMNEYGLGYYLGRRTGFEGEPSILVRNLNGFFPPELAVNQDTIKTVTELGYKWILVDETASDRKPGIYKLSGLDTELVVRDRELSNVLAFKRNSELEEIKPLISGDHVIALDGETFGHHNKEGILLLENLFTYIEEKNGRFLKVSDLVEDKEEETLLELESIKESTWGANDEDMSKSEIYPMWDSPENTTQKLLWEIFYEVLRTFENVKYSHPELENSETLPVWKEFPTEDIKLLNTFMKSLSSDQFWWASGKTLPNGDVLYAEDMIRNSLDVYKELASLKNSPELSSVVLSNTEKITASFKR